MKNNTNEIYHSDHLGSSSYITDNFGRPSHYYEYLPFGELMTEHNQSKYYIDPYPTQNMDSYNNPYKFNDFGGKSERALPERTARSAEMDKETGMYYYGARYYDPRISIFVSVDPLAEQAPNWTPYRYAFNNPVMVTDPTGLFETKLGAWWHKQWNGNDSSSDIMYDDKREEYYYTNHYGYTDEDGNDAMHMDFIYNSKKGDGGRFVFEIEAKASLGVQVGASLPIGNIEAGIITADIGSIGYSNQAPDAPIAKWGDGTGHNFIGGGLGYKGIGLFGKVDYVTKDMVPHGDIPTYYANNGYTDYELGIGPTRSLGLSKNPESLSNALGAGLGIKGGKPSGSNNKVIDINIGIKAILGIDLSIKTGFTGKDK